MTIELLIKDIYDKLIELSKVIPEKRMAQILDGIVDLLSVLVTQTSK